MTRLQSPESRGRRGFWITEVTGKDAEPARCSRVTLPWDWLRLSIKKGDKVDSRSCRSSAQSQGLSLLSSHPKRSAPMSAQGTGSCLRDLRRQLHYDGQPPSLGRSHFHREPLSATRGVGDFPRGRKDAAVTPVGAAGGTFPSAFPALDKARQGQFALHSQHLLRQNRTGPDVSARVTCKAYAPPGRGGP